MHGMLAERIDLARKPSRLRTSSPTATPGLSAEGARPGAVASIERGARMNPSTGSYEHDGAAQRRAQRVLNEKVGDRLEQRSWLQRRRWRRATEDSPKKAPAEQ